jgi:hypothetical protein
MPAPLNEDGKVDALIEDQQLTCFDAALNDLDVLLETLVDVHGEPPLNGIDVDLRPSREAVRECLTRARLLMGAMDKLHREALERMNRLHVATVELNGVEASRPRGGRANRVKA